MCIVSVVHVGAGEQPSGGEYATTVQACYAARAAKSMSAYFEREKAKMVTLTVTPVESQRFCKSQRG